MVESNLHAMAWEHPGQSHQFPLGGKGTDKEFRLRLPARNSPKEEKCLGLLDLGEGEKGGKECLVAGLELLRGPGGQGMADCIPQPALLLSGGSRCAH